ncbi:hypothetical protein Ancab_014115 [Ancistrocladus abbreviatus]
MKQCNCIVFNIRCSGLLYDMSNIYISPILHSLVGCCMVIASSVIIRYYRTRQGIHVLVMSSVMKAVSIFDICNPSCVFFPIVFPANFGTRPHTSLAGKI